MWFAHFNKQRSVFQNFSPSISGVINRTKYQNRHTVKSEGETKLQQNMVLAAK